jgi:hypothetical protein
VEFEAVLVAEAGMAVGAGAGAPVLFQRGDLFTLQFLIGIAGITGKVFLEISKVV